MHTSVPPKLVRAVRQAAELRVAGQLWEDVARRLNRRTKTVRDWPHLYPAFWEGVIAQARRDSIAQAGDEARALLRNLMRVTEPDMRRDAAKKLIDHFDAAARSAPDPTPTHSDDELEGLTDEDYDAILGKADADNSESRAVGTSAPPGP